MRGFSPYKEFTTWANGETRLGKPRISRNLMQLQRENA